MTRIPEAVVELTEAVMESESLRVALMDIYQLPVPLRIAAVERIAAEMRQGYEDEELIAAIGSLSKPEVFDAVIQTLEAPTQK